MHNSTGVVIAYIWEKVHSTSEQIQCDCFDVVEFE